MTNVHYESFDYGAGRGQIDRRRRFTALTILATILSAGISVCDSSVMTDSLARRMRGIRIKS
jgi:hypothetical protein